MNGQYTKIPAAAAAALRTEKESSEGGGVEASVNADDVWSHAATVEPKKRLSDLFYFGSLTY